jgi:undecaprenyl-diphosphatase
VSFLLSLALVVGGIWFFVELAQEVVEGSTRTADEEILLAMRDPDDRSDPLGPQWFEEMVRDYTALGSTGVLVLLAAGVAGFLMLRGHYEPAVLLLITVIGGFLLSNLLKLGFDRPRPELVPRATLVYNASFPSGHSLI